MKGSMPTPTSIFARKATEMVSDQFPAGLRVLVVDDDPTCLRILEKMLQNCCYAGLFNSNFFFLLSFLGSLLFVFSFPFLGFRLHVFCFVIVIIHTVQFHRSFLLGSFKFRVASDLQSLLFLGIETC